MGTPPVWIRSSLLVCASLMVTSCAGPPARPLEPSELARRVEDRAAVEPDVLLAAIALHDAPPLGLTLPEELDPDQDAFWHTHAIAFEPVVRALRRSWRAARYAAGAAGAPGRTGLTYRMEDLDDPERQSEVAATVDLLGLLGLGPKAAELEVATRVTKVALGRLEQSVWSAAFGVDRARVRLAAARRRDARLDGLATTARSDLRRLELLFERGRMPDGLIGRARATIAAFESQRHQLAAETVRAREVLARASGLPPQTPALDAVGDVILDREIEAPASTPDGVRLLEALPSLRATRLEYALSEARLRAAAAEWWPGLRLGPHLKIRPDELLTGGVLSVDLPWPSTVEAQIEAAVERRAQAREAVEDELARALNAVAARRQEVLIAQDHLETHAKVLLAESARAWRAARATLLVREGQDVVETWLDALQLRSRGLLDEVNATEAVMVSELSFREAAGVLPGLEPEDDR